MKTLFPTLEIRSFVTNQVINNAKSYETVLVVVMQPRLSKLGNKVVA